MPWVEKKRWPHTCRKPNPNLPFYLHFVADDSRWKCRTCGKVWQLCTPALQTGSARRWKPEDGRDSR